MNINNFKKSYENIVQENEILELVGKPGLYKAYHMNKKSWISIVLNDTLDDEIIFSFAF